jgi:electron transfer flavoprotein alpha subunit
MTAVAVKRVDPRRPAVVTPAGLRRIVLGSSEGERLTGSVPARHGVTVKSLRSPGPFTHCTLVVAHAERGTLDEHARQVVAAAAILAAADGEVVVAVLGACHDDAAALGIDRLLVQEDFDPAAYQPEATVQWLLHWHGELRPMRCLMADRGADGELGRRFAAAAGLSLACHVVELAADRVRLRAAGGLDALGAPTALMLLARGVASAALPFVGHGRRIATGATGAAAALPAAGSVGVEDLGLQAGQPQTLALEEADFILAAGNGVTDVPLFEALAEALGAATGASRVAVDDGRFPRARQIGASGKTVSASAYLALGISGAVQHLQGIKACRHVIAVNLDAAAPIVRRAALTVVEDSGELMRALLDQLQQSSVPHDA